MVIFLFEFEPKIIVIDVNFANTEVLLILSIKMNF